MRFLVIALICSACAPQASAQVPYKYIAPNDKSVTYSDLPPPPNAKVLKQRGAPVSVTSGPAFPFELQQASSNFPVVIYTTTPCSSCDEGRNLLTNRGIPFSERTVKSNDDILTVKRLSPEGTVPLLIVGKNKAIGFSLNSWSELLDQAGYPASSKLPPNYQNPPPESAAPVIVKETPSADAGGLSRAQGSAPRTLPGQPDAESPSSPAPPGFRF